MIKEELERIIRQRLSACAEEYERGKGVYTNIENIVAEAILDKLPELGFVRLEDVEIDVEKLRVLLMEPSNGLHTSLDEATAIAEARPLRVKEGK